MTWWSLYNRARRLFGLETKWREVMQPAQYFIGEGVEEVIMEAIIKEVEKDKPK